MSADPLRVAIVGGGLAGLAAAVALAGEGAAGVLGRRLEILLFESRRQIGGRATSFLDKESGEAIDHCQHVSLGCCTNLADFCQRTGLADLFRRDRTMHFVGSDGRISQLTGSRWLPAPLHLLPSLLCLKHLTFSERLRIVWGLHRLVRATKVDSANGQNMQQWLTTHGQTSRCIELFWLPIIVSALSEVPDRVSVPVARKVFVDGLMRARSAYEMLVPRVPLSELYGERLTGWLQAHGVQVQAGSAVRTIRAAEQGGLELELAGSVPGANDDAPQRESYDAVICALPWREIGSIFSPDLAARLPFHGNLERFKSAPISGVHLWLDRALTDLPHAVLPGRLSQWVFNRSSGNTYYYQVVISASHELAGRAKEDVVAQVFAELREAFPAATDAQLLRWRIVTERAAVFAPLPGMEELRPAQETPVPGLFLAGDWTATGWPATMEGAVRSGYLAAEALLAQFGSSKSVGTRILADDLPVARLARWLLGVR
ncbi:MAG: hydroxysqualene dehydroxylase HpnE [Planctomycetota bacterium]|nr:hydroxysqualene dehydroxylase HpnE [Planctomycetota bacterium]